MRTRIIIGLACVFGIAGAGYAHDLAAAYVAGVGAGIFYLLHTIEFKLNKLLDHHGIQVSDHEIASD
jgi:hypothetical protein